MFKKVICYNLIYWKLKPMTFMSVFFNIYSNSKQKHHRKLGKCMSRSWKNL